MCRFLFLLALVGCSQEYDINSDDNGPDMPGIVGTVTSDTGLPPLTVDTPITVDTGTDPELEPPFLPEMLVVPAFYDFGDLKINCTDEYEATISSVGTSTLIIDSWAYNNTTGMSMETDIELPLSLEPGEEATIKFIYEEKDLFIDRGRLYIDSNDFMDPRQLISNEGQGVPTGTQIDNFSQGGESKADILFVVDNSCSMGNEQEALGENSDLFIQNLLDSDVDFQIAVITTDNTALRNGIMTNDTAGVEDLLQDAIVAGTMGSPYEMGQEYAKLALEPGGTLEFTGPFQREDAFLSIIIVSDEEDSSPLDDTEYRDFFSSLKEDKMSALHTVVSTVPNRIDVGPNPGGGGGGGSGGGPGWRFHTGDTGAMTCDTGHTGDTGDTAPVIPAVPQCGTYGGRYIDQSLSLDGTTLNICEGNWGEYVGILAKDSFNPNLIFPLSRIPMEDSIVIKSDGVVLSSGWEYDDVGNLINFIPALAPGEDELVQIIYDYATECEE